MEKKNICINLKCQMWVLVVLSLIWMPVVAFSGTVEFGLLQNMATYDTGSKQISGVMDVVGSNASEASNNGHNITVGQIEFAGNSFTMSGYAEPGNDSTNFTVHGNYAFTGNDQNNGLSSSEGVQFTISVTTNLGLYTSHGLPQISDGSMHTFRTRYAGADSLTCAPTEKLVLTSAQIVFNNAPNTPPPSNVPIPSAAWMMGTCIIGLWGIRRRTGR